VEKKPYRMFSSSELSSPGDESGHHSVKNQRGFMNQANKRGTVAMRFSIQGEESCGEPTALLTLYCRVDKDIHYKFEDRAGFNVPPGSEQRETRVSRHTRVRLGDVIESGLVPSSL